MSRENFTLTMVRNLGKHDSNFLETKILPKKEFRTGSEWRLTSTVWIVGPTTSNDLNFKGVSAHNFYLKLFNILNIELFQCSICVIELNRR